MIRKIYSTLSTFNTIELHEGLNILLADITQRSTVKDTRNGLGKLRLLRLFIFYMVVVVQRIVSLKWINLKMNFSLWI